MKKNTSCYASLHSKDLILTPLLTLLNVAYSIWKYTDDKRFERAQKQISVLLSQQLSQFSPAFWQSLSTWDCKRSLANHFCPASCNRTHPYPHVRVMSFSKLNSTHGKKSSFECTVHILYVYLSSIRSAWWPVTLRQDDLLILRLVVLPTVLILVGIRICIHKLFFSQILGI